MYAVCWDTTIAEHKAKLSLATRDALPASSGILSSAHLMSELRNACPADTVWVIEAVTNARIAADQIQATLPESWIICGGGGLGWSGGGALGVKLAMDAYVLDFFVSKPR